MIPMIHKACGQPAFWATERPRLAERPDLSKLRLADGSTPLAGSQMECASCGRRFQLHEVAPEGGFGLAPG